MAAHDVMARLPVDARGALPCAGADDPLLMPGAGQMSAATGRLRCMVGSRLAALSVAGESAAWRMAAVPLLADMPALFRMANGAALRVARVAGRPVALDDADADAALAALDGLEPVILALEHRLGIDLEPVAIGPLAADFDGENAVAVEVRLGGAGGAATTTEVALILPHDIVFAAGESATEAMYREQALLRAPVPVPVTLVLAGPRLPVALAAGLAKGDLVLLGPGAVCASLTVPGGAIASGRFDPMTACFTCGAAVPPGPSSGDVPMSTVVAAPGPPGVIGVTTPAPGAATDAHQEPAGPTPAQTLAAFAVPTAISLGERLVPLAELAALAPGCVMMLDHLLDQAEVSITVGGRAIAYGNFVKVGDAHAVLIGRLAAAAPADLPAAGQ
ncbi:MAG: FliM/FliN family flagellar motor switch protein [Sphingomonas sp.]